MHSSEFTSAAEHIGKRALVIGACNSGWYITLSYRTTLHISSGHDIAQDFFNHGIDVTMYVSSGGFIISMYLMSY
jgi:cation diffusion facilitator CzcD-associated flavoprotein CzcO